MKTGYWVTRTYKSGPIGEKIKFFVPGKKPSKKERRLNAKRLKTEMKKQKWNDQNAVKRIARDIHANFYGGKDYLVGMDYSDKHLPEDREGAVKQLRLWLERVRRACKKAGVEFRYVCITSDIDGDTGEPVRLHHHAVINAEAMEIALGKWTAGSTYHSKLDGRPDKTCLAEYLLKQVRRSVPDEKKYIPSRNLAHPMPKDRICEGKAEIQLPRHAMLLHRSEYTDGKPQYIRYILPGYAQQEVDEENDRTIYL